MYNKNRLSKIRRDFFPSQQERSLNYHLGFRSTGVLFLRKPITLESDHDTRLSFQMQLFKRVPLTAESL